MPSPAAFDDGSPDGTDDVIHFPGARIRLGNSAGEPMFEKSETWMAIGPNEPSSTEPTLIDVEMHAGNEMALVSKLLPDAMTVATPAARRLLMAALTACTLASGSLSHLTLVNPPPRLMFTAATGIPSCFCCSTCSSAATRSDANVVGDPKSFENTWTARICAPGPTPVRGRTPAAAPLPAAMPATCVPWLHSSKPDGNGSKEHGTAAPAPICVSVPFGQSPTPSPVASVPLAKHASPTTLPAKNSCEP